MSEAIIFNGTTYFTEDELRCKGSGKIQLSKHFPDQLLALRIAYGNPMIITSGCRSMKHNENIGGAKNSFHILDHPDRDGTAAVDVKATDGVTRKELIQLALNMGWSVGIADTFIHLDRRVDFGYDQIVFTY